MNLYNTLTRQKEELKPLKKGVIGMYCCGPTVYNYAHIGNLRTFLFEDFLRRALEFSGYKVNQVMNITDVGHLTSDADEGEDKMAKGVKNMLYVRCTNPKCKKDTPIWVQNAPGPSFETVEFKNCATDCIYCKQEVVFNKKADVYTYDAHPIPNCDVFYKDKATSPWKLREHYTDAFFADIDALNIQRATKYPRATDHIQEMIALIQRLEKNGFTYIAGGNVYFDTSKLNDYGKLAGDIVGTRHGASETHARVAVDPNKKHPHDFVLWFTESKHGNQDMQWDSPWGRGFPGWHIECSAMSMKYLGDHFDIHCGGIDHISVHHTNEIAQSEGALKNEWVHTWLHGNFLTIKNSGKAVIHHGQKMAKSGENFITLQTLKDHGFSALDYRYFCMQAHYSKELIFSWEGLDAAKTALRRLKEKIKNLSKAAPRRGPTSKGGSRPAPTKKYLPSFTSALEDDLNMPQALALVWELVDDEKISAIDKLSTIQKMDEVLGLKLDEETTFDIPKNIQKLIDERNVARAKKDWKKSDELRDQIQTSGYLVKDENGRTIVEPK